jgi:hypothetical protein
MLFVQRMAIPRTTNIILGIGEVNPGVSRTPPVTTTTITVKLTTRTALLMKN